jgi:hypothetical protein
VKEWFGKLAESDDIPKFEPREFLEGPNHVTVLGWEQTAPRPNGKVFESEWVHVFIHQGWESQPVDRHAGHGRLRRGRKIDGPIRRQPARCLKSAEAPLVVSSPPTSPLLMGAGSAPSAQGARGAGVLG